MTVAVLRSRLDFVREARVPITTPRLRVPRGVGDRRIVLDVPDPELSAMLIWAAEAVGLEWNPPPCPAQSRLDECQRQLFHQDGHHPNKLGSRVLKDNIYFSLNHPSAVCANPLNLNGTHTPGHGMNDHRTSLQQQNGHAVDISHKDNDNTTPPQQPLLTDTISAEPCPQSSPQSDILELLQDSAPKDDFLENSQGSQDSILQPPITQDQQPLSPDTLSLSPASPLLCYSQKMEELVYVGTKLSHSFAASPQISTKKRQAPQPPKPAGPSHPSPASVRALRPLPQHQGPHPPPSARVAGKYVLIARFLREQGWVSDAEACDSTQYAEAKINLWKYLGLEDNTTQNDRMWPLMNNYKYNPYYANQPANTYVDISVSSITNVDEKAQSLTTQVKMITAWPNLKMKWNPDDFCQIKTFAAPQNMFWTPDIGIIESIKTEFGTKESPYVLLLSEGFTVSTDILSLTTACKMDLYRFPFDTQTCNITLQSTVYSDQEIVINRLSDANSIFFKSKEIFQSLGEWNLTNIISIAHTTDDDIEWRKMHQLIYKITIKRRPLLYVINIIIPVFFFLVLDLISFFVDSNISEKVTFKVTLLLSISVMLLVINNTLPSTGTEIPLIGVFCGVIFFLIAISMMETILVNYLSIKGAEKRSVETKAAVTGQDVGVIDQQNPPDSVRDQNEEQSYTLDCLKQILTECRQKTPLYWTR
ncbi:unnamed protein product [Leuciscus chuanchicus]